MIYQVVWKDTGKPYQGTLQSSPDKEALELALTEMLEVVDGLRGKLEVREKP